jgi:hypothetical protein
MRDTKILHFDICILNFLKKLARSHGPKKPNIHNLFR